MFLPPELGHKFVMVFFVLSGYLIAYSTIGKQKTLEQYFIDRLSRLYSVVFPALVFTYLIDFIGCKLNPDFYYSQIAPNGQPIRFLTNFFFLQQIWNLCTKPSANTVFWSISYEFWYYILFGILYYLNGYKKWIWGIVILCIIGPKIILLGPVWLMGVVAYRLTQSTKIIKLPFTWLFFITLFITVGLNFTHYLEFKMEVYSFGQPPLFFSSFFIYDWLYGLLVSINIFCFAMMNKEKSLLKENIIQQSIKYLAGKTFSLYLYHIPTLLFLAAVIPYDRGNYFQLWGLILFAWAIVFLLSLISEPKRLFWATIFERIIQWARSKWLKGIVE